MLVLQKRGPLLPFSQAAFWLLAGVLLLSGFVDVPRQFSFGPMSFLGVLMVFCVAAPLLCWLAKPRLYHSLVGAIAPFLLYILWSCLTAVWAPPSFTGVQNLLAPVAFCSLALLASSFSRTKPEGWRRITRVLLVATGIAVGLYGLNLVIAGLGTSAIIGARTFALFALFGLTFCLAAWRYGWKPGLWLALLIMAAIGASLSRMALGVAVLLFLLAQVPLRDRWGGIRLILVGALLAALSFQLVTRIEPLRERFMEGDTSLQVGGVAINATGRTAMWSALLDSARESPWLGKGAGSAGALIVTRFPGLGQAHSDYLRILHDHGTVGLALWVLGMITLLRSLARAWTDADGRRDPTAALHLSAILALVSVALAMATDNPLVYVFVMAPFGILVGTSLGAMRRPMP